MKTKPISNLFALLSAVLVVACDGPHSDDDERNEKMQRIELTPTQKVLTGGVNDLAFDVFDKLVDPADYKDMLLSPLSLSACLSMVANGADGATQEQMLSVLGFEGQSLSELNAYYNLIIDALIKADRKVDFLTANSVWVAPDYELHDEFVRTVEENYLAKVDNVDFGTQSGIDRINRWCSDNTDGKIAKFFDKPNPDLKVFLANALYFNGTWEEEFKRVEEREFTHVDGSTSPVRSIVDSDTFAYYADEHLACVEVPYGNGAYAMDFILPTEGVAMDEAAAHLAGEGVWDNVTHSFYYPEVVLEFPRFRIEGDMNLNDILISLGMTDAFSPINADFSKMSPGDLFLSFVSQKSYIDVTEKGTTAAAVTGSGMVGSIGPSDRVEFKADRPFFFLIRERSTGVVLFVGAKM